MEFEDEDRICFKNHYFLDADSAQKLSYHITRAPSTTNKENARDLLMRTDTLVYRRYLSQIDKVGEYFLDTTGIGVGRWI